jgi:hypothetical protein
MSGGGGSGSTDLLALELELSIEFGPEDPFEFELVSQEAPSKASAARISVKRAFMNKASFRYNGRYRRVNEPRWPADPETQLFDFTHESSQGRL